MADYTQLMNLEKKHKGETSPTTQSTLQSINQSTNQPTNQLTNRPTNPQSFATGTKIVEKPKAFYITERLNKRLDEAVRYFQEKHGIKKVDRSTLVNVMLDAEANWTEENLDKLVEKVISQLTSRLTNR
jgi:hypothetical protein